MKEALIQSTGFHAEGEWIGGKPRLHLFSGGIRLSVCRAVLPALMACMLADPAFAYDPLNCVSSRQEIVSQGASFIQSAVRQRHQLRIVALGSSSTKGIGASGPASSYPSRLETVLAQRLPADKIVVLNRGIGGDTIDGMLARFDRDVAKTKPDLLILQTGPNEMRQRMQPARLQEGIASIIARSRALGADVLLMTPQFSVETTGNPLLPDYLQAFEKAAEDGSASVFRRYQIMRSWVDQGTFTMTTMLSNDGFHMTDGSYDCLARVLADFIVNLVREDNGHVN
jgi:lysophospholipase L1-like esterase